MDFYDAYLCEQQSWYLAMEVFDLYYYGGPEVLEDVLEKEYAPEDTNAHIRLLRGDELLLENEAPEHVSSRSAREYLFGGIRRRVHRVPGRGRPLVAADGYLDAYRQYSFLSRYSRTFLLAGGAGLLLAAVSLVFLFCAAGHPVRHGGDLPGLF